MIEETQSNQFANPVFTNNIIRNIEAILFSSSEPVELSKLKSIFKDSSEEDISTAIKILKERYATDEYSFEIVEYEGNRYCFVTKHQYAPILKKFYNIQENLKLNRGVLETLAIIAYKGPITKSEIDLIRGVNSSGAIDSLLEKELIEIVGKKESIGKPLLYNVTEKFFQYLGIKNKTELPLIES